MRRAWRCANEDVARLSPLGFEHINRRALGFPLMIGPGPRLYPAPGVTNVGSGPCSGEKGTTFTVVFPKGSNWIGTNAAA